MKSVTIVIPVLNEAAAIAANMRQIMESVKSLGATVDARILVVDDGSHDDTVCIIQHLAEPSRSSRCWPHAELREEAAIHAGLDHTSSDAVIVMDSDLQHRRYCCPG